MSEFKEIVVGKFFVLSSISMTIRDDKYYQIRVCSEDNDNASKPDLILHFKDKQCLELIGQLKALVGDSSSKPF